MEKKLIDQLIKIETRMQLDIIDMYNNQNMENIKD